MSRPVLRVITNPNLPSQPEIVSVHTLPETAGPSGIGRIDDGGWYRGADEHPVESLPLQAISWGVSDMVWQAYEEGRLTDNDVLRWGAGEGALVVLVEYDCIIWTDGPVEPSMILLAQGCDVPDLTVLTVEAGQVAGWLLQLQWESWLAQFEEQQAVLTPSVIRHFQNPAF